ncbi:MAG: sugar ABC transporter permease [Epulopiscium sp. Nuni2H_MBin003]|nr:MAG: sugar ABC transporter permease [Epulopiscium sp. Nuni2H_MBin003]
MDTLEEKQSLAQKMGLTLNYAILIIWSITIIAPILQMIVFAFSINHTFTFNNFEYLVENTLYLTWVINTVFIAATTGLVTLIFVSMTGFAYSRYRFKGKRASLMFLAIIQIIPSFAGMVAYFMLQSIIGEFLPFFSRQMMLICIYSAAGIAGNTFILKGYLDSVSTELDDAARIDGCSEVKVYRLIILPIARPILSLIGFWSVIGPFMDYLLPRVLLTNPESYTLAAGLYTLAIGTDDIDQSAFAAGSLLIAIPTAIVFSLLQRYLIGGLYNKVS